MSDITTQVKPIAFDYLDYRVFLSALIEYLRTRGEYSQREFAKKAGFRSSSFMKLVLDKKRNLSNQSIKRVIRALELSQHEGSYLYHLVKYNQATSTTDQALAYKGLLATRSPKKYKLLQPDQMKLFSRWHYVAILEALGTSWSKKSTKEMASSLGIREIQVLRALKALFQLGLIKKEKSQWVRTEASMDTAPQVQSLILRSFHKEMIGKALEKVELLDLAERELGSLTISLSHENFELVKRRFRELRQEINQQMSNEVDPESVIQINYQMFPLIRLR